MLPQLVPTTPEDPACAANKRAWEVLRKWQKPFLTASVTRTRSRVGRQSYSNRKFPAARTAAYHDQRRRAISFRKRTARSWHA